MFVTFHVLIVCLIFPIFETFAGPTHISAVEKHFGSAANLQSVQFTLTSIEDKLRNLENTLSVQCSTAIDGKIDYYGRKIDNIEKDLSRFQIFIRMELDKISENISSKNFKDDITKDRIIRKIDSVYERMHHKLGNIEGQMDISSMKSQNGREMIITKLEKMEESLTIRDADMEAELADAVAAIDDLKTTCSNMEENILNITKDTTKTFAKTTERIMKKHHGQTINSIEETNKNLSQGITNLQGAIHSLLNQTGDNLQTVNDIKEELEENLNEYANKIIDMHSDAREKVNTMDKNLDILQKILNLTRSEQQNGLRALMIQVGRKSDSKQNYQSNSENQKLEELSQKIDLNFENIMQAQTLFLESCHRVQMDEPQFESQISMILHKVIDIFEKKTSVGPKDIEKLEHLIRTHDSNIRGSIYHITNTLLASTQKATDGKDEIIDYINNQKLQLEAVYILLEDVLYSNDSVKIQTILDTLEDIQRKLNQTYQVTQESQLQINLTKSFINHMLRVPSDLIAKANNIKLQQTLEFIKNIYHILMGIEMKINKSHFNKYPMAQQLNQEFNDNIEISGTSNITTQQENSGLETALKDKEQLHELIFQIFGQNLHEQETLTNLHNYLTKKINLLQTSNNTREEIDYIFLLCENETTDCEKINTTKYKLVKSNDIASTINTNNENSTKVNPPQSTLIEVIQSGLYALNNNNNTNEETYSIKQRVLSTASTNDFTNLNYTENGGTISTTVFVDEVTIDSDVVVTFDKTEKNQKQTVAATEGLVTNMKGTTENTENLTETTAFATINDEHSVTEETTQTTEENYDINSQEYDSTEINGEFEYTNHEYH